MRFFLAMLWLLFLIGVVYAKNIRTLKSNKAQWLNETHWAKQMLKQ